MIEQYMKSLRDKLNEVCRKKRRNAEVHCGRERCFCQRAAPDNDRTGKRYQAIDVYSCDKGDWYIGRGTA